MTNPFSRTEPLMDAFEISSYVPSEALGLPLSMTEEDALSILGDDYEITSFDSFMEGMNRVVSLYAKTEEGAFAKLSIIQQSDRDNMPQELMQSFDMISAPINSVKGIKTPKADRLAALGEGFAVGARGDIMISATTSKGVSASDVVIKTLSYIFDGK